MKRRKKSGERREEIIHACAQLLARDGIEALSIRKVAREVGFTSGVVTHYFVDKDELLQAMFTSIGEVSLQVIDASINSADTPLEAIAAILHDAQAENMKRFPRSPKLWAATRYLASSNDALGEIYQDFIAKWRRVMQKLVLKAIAVGEIDSDMSARDIAELLVTYEIGLWSRAHIDPAKFSPKARRRYLVTLINLLAGEAGKVKLRRSA